ncbi:MAG: hypothetical protein EBU90_12240 [Proteobacteria bacterium]|nr:hypothetical protein [Pseudomonadota bacterium]
MKIKESWSATKAAKAVKLVEEWKAHRSVKDKPVFTVMKNGYAYHNAFLRNIFYYENVYYKFTDNGIRFSYYEKRGYSLLKHLIRFPSEYVPTTNKNVFILEKVGNMKYEFLKNNKIAKIKIFKQHEQD